MKCSVLSQCFEYLHLFYPRFFLHFAFKRSDFISRVRKNKICRKPLGKIVDPSKYSSSYHTKSKFTRVCRHWLLHLTDLVELLRNVD